MEDIDKKDELLPSEPQKLENTGRNKDGTFKEGHIKIPGSGRPKNSLKDFIRKKLAEMPDEEKEKWLQEMNISGIDQWKMAEGNPSNDDKLNSTVKIIIANEADDCTNNNTEGQPQI